MARISAAGARGALPDTLVEMTANRLRDAILSGELEAGDKILEEQLCAELGISRAPLREALRVLAQQGLVEHLPRRGSRVVDWSPGDFLELFEVRAVLERHAVDCALPLVDATSALLPVREALEQMRSATTDLARDDAHRRFHASIVSLAGNRQLDIALAPILLKLQLPMARNLREEGRRGAGDGIARHQRLIDALDSNDAAEVHAALREHGHLDYLELRAAKAPR